MDINLALDIIVIALFFAAASGICGLAFSRNSIPGQWVVTTLMSISMLCGITGAFIQILYMSHSTQNVVRILPWLSAGVAWIGLDSLSAFFLVPIFLIGGLGSIYSLGYWRQSEHKDNGQKLRLFWGFLVAGMIMLVLATNGLAFLLGWEIMALSAFFLVSTEDKKADSREAAFIYLIATHVGTLALFFLFSLWRSATGSYAFIPASVQQINLTTLNILFFISLFCFGLKAGVMPFHFWLPQAHASSPSHVSAMLSGVVLKMGIYGMIRFYSLLPNPPMAWGIILLGFGAFSALFGVVFALAQHDLKRLLAYHSVENIGIIMMGLGIAMMGRTTGNNVMLVLGLGGALLHTWNHSIFKSLLFLGAGSVLHATGTRQIDILGGLSKRMPLTAFLFLVGSVAICGLPPLNGFISELFIYLGLFENLTNEGTKGMIISMTAPILGAVGALAIACFVKVYGTVFSGNPQSKLASKAKEAPAIMIFPMSVLALCCLIIGTTPILIAPVLNAAITAWIPGTANSLSLSSSLIQNLSPLKTLSVYMLALAILLLLGFAATKTFFQKRRSVLTWDCGYAQPDRRMQYTASSFAKSILNLFSWVLRIKERVPEVKGHFPAHTQFSSHTDEPVLDRIIIPTASKTEKLFAWFHRFQQGQIQFYIVSILVTLLILLCTLVPFPQFIIGLFAR